MQQPSPSEQSGYAGPNARQELDRYIPPGFTIQRQGETLLSFLCVCDNPVCTQDARSLSGHVNVTVQYVRKILAPYLVM